MRLSAKSLALASALLWGGALFVMGMINLVAPGYGADFLHLIGSVYPGFYASRTFPDVLLGTAYGLIDGAVGGLIFAWLYNRFAGPRDQSKTTPLDKAA